MEKETAVDFLFSKTKKNLEGRKLNEVLEHLDLVNESKKIEFEQIFLAFKMGFEYRDSFGWEGEISFDHEDHAKAFSDYYLNTYKKQNEQQTIKE
jgi:hypothetical protein